jgi:hypothetical protein
MRTTGTVKVGKAFYLLLNLLVTLGQVFLSRSLISIIYSFEDTISCRCGRNRTTNSELPLPSVF